MMMMENSLPPSMASSSPPTLFSVKFFDGERELDMGTVPIAPSLTFKSFQSILSQKLQRSPHQITIYFERQKMNNNQGNFHHIHHHRQRYAVTSKFDFGSVMSESDSAFFWVVQKRSRRTRRRKPKPNDHFLNNGNNNFMLLRRDCNELEYLRMMQMKSQHHQQQQQCERYLMSLNLNSNVYDDLSSSFYGNSGFGGGYNCNFSDDGASSSGGGSSNDYGVGRVVGGFCDVCYQNAVLGETAAFHWCKNDAVTQVYRSPAGPIGPPKKKK